jgi:hypothetical protein
VIVQVILANEIDLCARIALTGSYCSLLPACLHKKQATELVVVLVCAVRWATSF